MSKSTTRIRIKLVRPIDIRATAMFQGIVRGDGPDEWEVKLTHVTSEGHTTIHRFTDESKTVALNKAYVWLEKNTVDLWLPAFREQMLDRYEDMLAVDKSFIERFEHSISALAIGKTSREDFRKAWDARAQYFKDKLPPPTNQEHVLVQEPAAPMPKKWRWYNWFYNPEGNK